ERITYEMFTSDNFPPWQLFNFLIPNLFGGVDRNIPDYAPATTVFVAEVYAYLGILPLTFVFAGLSVRRRVCRELKFWILVAVMLRLLAEGWFSQFLTIPDSIHLNYYYTFSTAKQVIIRNLSWNSPTLFMPILFFFLAVGTLLLLTRRGTRIITLIAIPVL